MRFNPMWPIAVFTVPALSAPLMAQEEQVLTGPPQSWVEPSELAPVPSDAAGLVYVRRQDMLVHLQEEGQLTYMGQRMKLLHPQALEAGNLALTWNPAAGAPTVHALQIHRDGEVIDVLANNTFEILRREGQLEQAMLNGLLTAVLRVPDLRVGDELEWAFTSPSHDPTLRDDSFGLLALVPAPPAGRFRLGLSWEDGQEPTVQLTEDFAKRVQRSPRAVEVRFDDPEMFSPPKEAPPRYGWQRLIEYSDFASWPAVSRRFDPLFTAASKLSPDSPVRQEAARIARAHPAGLAQAQAALALVQQQVRYVYVGLEGGNFSPASADETWRRRYGDCKGKTALLLALLNELGIEAEAVLASNSGSDDGLDDRLPNPGLFDHVLVRARIDGDTYWLDGTLPKVVEGGSDPFFPYRWVLPLSESGSALEAVRQAPLPLPTEMGLFEIDARAGFDQPARLVSTTVTRGLEGLTQYMQLSAMTRDQLKTGIENAFAGGSEWNAIEDVAYRYDPATRASILTITGTGPVAWDDEGDGTYGLALPGGGFSAPPRRQRAGSDQQDVPFYNEPGYSCYATTVRLPDGPPLKNWSFNTVFRQEIYGRLYYRMMELRDDGTIRMVRGSRVEDREISAEQARLDNERLEDFDNSKAYISYDPDDPYSPWGELRQVPAVYEIDWAKPDAPCLPLEEQDG